MTELLEERTWSHLPDARSLANKELLVLDYDGTIADLAVDWNELRRDLSAWARLELGFASDFRPLWPEISRVRRACGARALTGAFSIIGYHERFGLMKQRPNHAFVRYVRDLAASGTPPTQIQIAVFSSNLHGTVTLGLRKVGLLSLVSWIIGAEDVARWKPAPDGLELAMRFSNCNPDHTIFFGDSNNDEMAAQSAGVDFVRVRSDVICVDPKRLYKHTKQEREIV